MTVTPKQVASAASGFVFLVAVAAAPFIAKYEGNTPVAIHQKFDPPGVITWCHGNTNYDDPTVKVGTRFTPAECDALLAKTLPKYWTPIEKCLTVVVTVHQAISLLSASYNAGARAVCHSPMVRHFNAGQPKAACDSFRGWYITANHVRLQGLVNRREAERAMCLTED